MPIHQRAEVRQRTARVDERDGQRLARASPTGAASAPFWSMSAHVGHRVARLRACRRAGGGGGSVSGACPVRSIAVRYAVRVLDDERRPDQVARRPARRAARASLTLNGIVMPGMKPRMSSCLIVISCRAASTARICPRSSYCWPRARARQTTARRRSTQDRVTTSSTAHRCHCSSAVARGVKAAWLGDRPGHGMHSAILRAEVGARPLPAQVD